MELWALLLCIAIGPVCLLQTMSVWAEDWLTSVCTDVLSDLGSPPVGGLRIHNYQSQLYAQEGIHRQCERGRAFADYVTGNPFVIVTSAWNLLAILAVLKGLELTSINVKFLRKDVPVHDWFLERTSPSKMVTDDSLLDLVTDSIDFPLTSVELKEKVHSVVGQVAATLKTIAYLGVNKEVTIPNMAPTLHPYDTTIANLLGKPGKIQSIVDNCTSMFKRVNPTFKLKLNHMRKFDGEQVLDEKYASRVPRIAAEVFDDIFDRMEKAGDLTKYRNDLANRLATHDFSDVDIDPSTAAGYPYRVGQKHSDVREDAEQQASKMMQSMKAFRTFMGKHVWYTTGRAKLVSRSDDDSARLIIYMGFAPQLIFMKYSNVFTDLFCKHARHFSAIGMSWANLGADKFASHFSMVKGRAAKGKKFMGLDVSGWDANVGPIYLRAVRDQHIRFIEKMLVGTGIDANDWTERIRILYDDMIDAKVLFPAGHTFQFRRGMKSGWPFTGVDNTIVHEIVMRLFDEDHGVTTPRQLGGDDNFMEVDVNLSGDAIKDHYKACGFTVKHVRESVNSYDVDFYSKFIRYDTESGHYYPWRPTNDTISRLIMPEEFDIERRKQPDIIIAAERIYGHLLDNWFNFEVRTALLDCLEHIAIHANVREVSIEKFRREARYRGFELPPIRAMPSLPDPSAIDQIFGFTLLPPSLSARFDNYSARSYEMANSTYFDTPRFSLTKQSESVHVGNISESASMMSNYVKAATTVGSSKDNLAKRATRPFKLDTIRESRGTAGGKVTQMILEHNIDLTPKRNAPPVRILLLGSHPGSMASALHYMYPDAHIDNVSIIPNQDKKRAFPKVPINNNVRIFDVDLMDFKPEGMYDLVVMDAYQVNEKIVSVAEAYDMVKTHAMFASAAVNRYAKHANAMFIKIRGFEEEQTYPILYDWYANKGFSHFSITKPLFSHPWNLENFVVLKRSSGKVAKPVKRRVLYHAINAYRNSMANRTQRWVEARSINLDRIVAGGEVLVNPWASDPDVQSRLRIAVGFPPIYGERKEVKLLLDIMAEDGWETSSLYDE